MRLTRDKSRKSFIINWCTGINYHIIQLSYFLLRFLLLFLSDHTGFLRNCGCCCLVITEVSEASTSAASSYHYYSMSLLRKLTAEGKFVHLTYTYPSSNWLINWLAWKLCLCCWFVGKKMTILYIFKYCILYFILFFILFLIFHTTKVPCYTNQKLF